MAWGAKIQGVENQAPEIQAAVREGVQAGMEEIGIKGAEMVQQNIATPYEGKPAAVCFGNLEASIVLEVSVAGRCGARDHRRQSAARC
jgi:hypothetical protein